MISKNVSDKCTPLSHLQPIGGIIYLKSHHNVTAEIAGIHLSGDRMYLLQFYAWYVDLPNASKQSFCSKLMDKYSL